MYNIFSNLLFGIVGGIVSSIIVSRMFWIMSELKTIIDVLDAEYGELCVLQGKMDALKVICEDNSIQSRSISSEVFSQIQIIKDDIKDDADKKWIDLVYLNVKENEVIDIIDTFIEYADSIKSMKQVSFEYLNDSKKIFDVCRKKVNEYKDTYGKRLIKRLLTDKMMIALYAVVLFDIVGVIITGLLGV